MKDLLERIRAFIGQRTPRERWLVILVVCVFGFGMVYYGTLLAEKTAGNKLPSLGISGAFDFLPIVIGGVMLILFSIERLARRAGGLKTARFGETELEG